MVPQGLPSARDPGLRSPNVLSEFSKEELVELTCELMDDYMLDNMDMLCHPNFHSVLDDDLFEMLKLVCAHIYDDNTEYELYDIIVKANRVYFTTMMPRRSYRGTFTKPLSAGQIAKLEARIAYLRELPQPDQRTTAWYEYRHNLITASNAWKGLGASQSHLNSLIYEKCQPINTEKFSNVNVDSPFHWGQKYEPLSVLVYEKDYNTVVEDFGCIQDEVHKFLGASPDGINVDKSSERYGRMLEIKNRFSYSVPITGIPKLEYWVQMQLQMNVCRLNECDFLETKFLEYESRQAFYEDAYEGQHEGYTGFTRTKAGERKGIFMFFNEHKNGVNKPLYFYPPLDMDEGAFEKWEQETLEQNADKQWISNIYWRLEKLSCVLVLRNKRWFEYATAALGEVWQTVLAERESGYEHRAPKKKRQQQQQWQSKPSAPVLLLDIVKLGVDVPPVAAANPGAAQGRAPTQQQQQPATCLIDIDNL